MYPCRKADGVRFVDIFRFHFFDRGCEISTSAVSLLPELGQLNTCALR